MFSLFFHPPCNFQISGTLSHVSVQLQPNKVLSRTVLEEWLAIFRGEDGKPVALRDRLIY